MTSPRIPIPLSGAVVRYWRTSDALKLASLADSRPVWRWLRDSFPHPYTVRHAHAWIKHALEGNPRTHFCLDVDNECAGAIGLTLDGDIYRGDAEIGYWLGEPYWGHGIATEAVAAVTEFAFANLPIHRVHACVFEGNAASARVLEKNGYVLEGRMRRRIEKDGQILDELVYGILR